MSTAVDTTRVTERRQLHFDSPDDILAEAERIARAREVRVLGNWPPGTIFRHLATVMNKSIDGFGVRFPAVLRFFLRLLAKRRVLTKPMSPGFRLSTKAATELVPPATGMQEGLDDLRRAVARLKADTGRAPSPFLGRMTAAEWDQLHCRHAELHLSFLVPVE
jgi:hypothetical protein